MTDRNRALFAVTFRDPHLERVVTLKARTVGDSQLGLGFICIGDFVFDGGGRLLDPLQERLQQRFEGVRRLHLNLYAIQAIEELGDDNSGLSLAGDRSNLVVLRPPQGEG